MLRVVDLRVRARGTALLDGVSFEITAGERVALVGSSGAGKSLLGCALLGLLPPPLTAEGSVRLDGVEVVGAQERALRRLRGTGIGLVAQDPATSLNPLVRVGTQVALPLRAAGLSHAAARQQALLLLAAVSLPDPATTARRHPGRLSGGQRQRVAIAMALAARPAVLVADEPTSALDATVQAGVLDLLTALPVAPDAPAPGLLLITHDLAVAAQTCDRVLVLDAGRLVADGTPRELFTDRAHPAVRALCEATEAMAL